MSLADRYAKRPTGAAPTDFACPHYQPVPEGKRCQNYQQGGGCTINDPLPCIEWLKANSDHRSPIFNAEDEALAGDLFGHTVPKPQRTAAPVPSDPVPSPEIPETRPPRPDAPLVRTVTDEEIASFRALGGSVCIATEHVGEVWLVPEYTKKDRFELSIDHAATLTAICAAFPGAKVTEIHRDTGEAPDADQDVPQD